MIRGNCKLALDIGGSSVKYGLIQDDTVTFYNELPVLSIQNPQRVSLAVFKVPSVFVKLKRSSGNYPFQV